MRRWSGSALLFGLSVSFIPLCFAEEVPGVLQQGRARVVFVGDSITGLGGGWKGVGFTFPLRRSLEKVYPGCEPQLLALGASGTGVRNWLNLIQKPLEQERYLDVKDVGLKATLDGGADVLVVMLGMNDILAPHVGSTPAELDQWRDQYRQLVQRLRARLHPRHVGLASVTMQTEDPSSPKNQLVAAMNERLRALAHELEAQYLPVNEAIWELHRRGRELDPQFHTTYDQIHPNRFGQLAIALGMLRGWGETNVAEHLERQHIAPMLATLLKQRPAFSYEILPGRLRYWWHGTNDVTPRVRLVAPEGWNVTPPEMTATSGEFAVGADSYRLENVFRLTADDISRDVVIPAPWLVTAGVIEAHWRGGDFDAARARDELVSAIEAGQDFWSRRSGWRVFFPSLNYKGGANPGSVDFAGVTHARNFEAGYGARWLESERDRPIELRMFTTGLAARVFLTVWVNGERVFAGLLTKKPATASARLRQGMNTLVFKSNHRTWEWQNTIEMHGADGAPLDDLRIRIQPPSS